MITYSRGSQSLAGTASLRCRMPVMIGAFGDHLDIAQWQSNSLRSCLARVRLPLSKPVCQTGAR